MDDSTMSRPAGAVFVNLDRDRSGNRWSQPAALWNAGRMTALDSLFCVLIQTSKAAILAAVQTFKGSPSFLQPPCNQQRHLQSLLVVEARVHLRLVGAFEVVFREIPGSAQAFSNFVPGQF